MRVTVLGLVLAASPLAALAQEPAVPETAATGGVMFNTSISLNVPLVAPDAAGKLAEEEEHRRALYARSVRECQILLDSIASACTITAINVSVQTNSSPGQPDYLYASSAITMDVTLK